MGVIPNFDYFSDFRSDFRYIFYFDADFIEK